MKRGNKKKANVEGRETAEERGQMGGGRGQAEPLCCC